MKLTKNWLAAALGLALVAASATFAPAPAEAALYRDLTIGSTGADVVELQTFLVVRGHLVMPAGVPMGYFGVLTRAALARYQASVGIVPAVGYFGPITRAHINAIVIVPPPADDDDDDDGDNDDDLRGGEGDIADFEILGNPNNEDLEEGDSENVLGFEFEAEDSDLRLERLEVFASTTDTGTDRPWDVFESARLLRGDDEIGEVTDLDDEDMWDEEDDDIYSFRFEDLDEIIREGDLARFFIELTAVANVDSEDDPTEIELYIPDNGLRAVDAEGIDIYEGDEDETRTVTVGETDSGDLELNLDDGDNEDRLVFVDEDSETDMVEIMRFTLESNSSDNTIDELQVTLTKTDATSTTFADVLTSLHLEVDGDEISSESVPSGAGAVTVTFEDLEDDFEVAEDEEVEVVVYADFDEQEGNYGEGFSFEASVAGSGIEAEDSSGDDVSVSGTVTGGEIEARVSGMTIEFVSAEENRTNGQVAGDADSVEFKIVFDVTAEGDDVYLDGDTVATGSPTTATDGLAWSTTSDSTTGTTTSTAIVTPNDGYKTGDTNAAGDKRLKVSDGNTRRFTFTVSIPAGSDNTAAGVQINGFKWDEDSVDTMDNLYTIDINEFRTDVVTGLYVR